MNLPVHIYSAESVRRIDSCAIDDAGIAGYTLMQRAAKSAMQAALHAFPGTRRWQIVCGGGNNGGDGYVMARLLQQHGLHVSTVSMVDPGKLGGDAATAYQDLVAADGNPCPWTGTLDPDAEIVVDAIFGSGLARAVAGPFAEAIESINNHPASVVALDLPSGIHADTGAALGTAVRADLTITFVGLKSGLFLGGAADYVGELVFAGLDIPQDCCNGLLPVMRRIDDSAIAPALQPRNRTAHKGDFGHLLVVGGGRGMPGAVRLAGEAALRCGAGRVSIATHPEHAAALASGRPELMSHGVERVADLSGLLQQATAIAVGPGLGTGAWADEMLEAVLSTTVPLVVDADALNLLARSARRRQNWVLTPHPGEAARLLRRSAAEVQADRLSTLDELQRQRGGVVVLKGAGSLVTSRNNLPWLCTSGNPGMAAPGVGDVLTGVIASLVAQGLDCETAAVAGVEIHARAGDAAAGAAPRGMLASDLLMELRQCVNRCA